MYTLTSVCIFSKLFSILFIRCWQGEFVHQSKANVSMVIISFVLMTLMCDSQVILKGEIRCWSLLRFKGLRTVQWGTLSIADVDPKLWIFFSRPDVHSQTSTCIYSLPIPFFIFNFSEKCSNQFYSDIFHLWLWPLSQRLRRNERNCFESQTIRFDVKYKRKVF